MESDERQFLLTAAWIFARHGQRSRARTLMEALCEANPRDGLSAAALATLMLSDGDGLGALRALRKANFPSALDRVEAILETRALNMIGRRAEGARRWTRYLESRKGGTRKWI